MSEQGERLNIRKATLRSWRTQFAANLREQGVTANATERAVRGQTAIQKRTSIFRATQRGESTHMNARIRFVSADLTKRSVEPDPHKETLAETRRHVEHGWSVVNDLFERDGQMQTARDVPRFLAQMRTPQTEQEQIAELIRTRSAGSRDDRDNRFR